MILITYVTPTSKLTCEPYNITYNLGVPLCRSSAWIAHSGEQRRSKFCFSMPSLCLETNTFIILLAVPMYVSAFMSTSLLRVHSLSVLARSCSACVTFAGFLLLEANVREATTITGILTELNHLSTAVSEMGPFSSWLRVNFAGSWLATPLFRSVSNIVSVLVVALAPVNVFISFSVMFAVEDAIADDARITVQ